MYLSYMTAIGPYMYTTGDRVFDIGLIILGFNGVTPYNYILYIGDYPLYG